MNAARKHRSWTPEQREDQSRKLRERQIWLQSTGPRTAEGKARSSRNACKPVSEEAIELAVMKCYLRTQKTYIDLLGYFHKNRDNLDKIARLLAIYHIKNLENELIDLEGALRSGALPTACIIPFPQGRRGDG